MGIVAVLAATALVIFVEKSNMKNKWNKKETIVFFTSLSIAASVTIAWVLRLNLLNPIEILADIYRPITEPYISYMKQFK